MRVSKYKHLFEKSYTPNWFSEIFTIERCQLRNPGITYLKMHKDN